MELLRFRPVEEGNCQVEAMLHTPITEMAVRRETLPTVVLCPGGGYEMVSQREADPVAQRFFAAGYNVFTLQTYSVGERARDFRPLGELSEVVRQVRLRKEWRCDPRRVAVCGFSAGAHLAGSLGTLYDDPWFVARRGDFQGLNRPDAMILCYPVITADQYAHEGSLRNVSGSEPGTQEYQYFGLDRHVREDTCPAFLWHTAQDDCVPVENTLAMMAALHKNGVPFETHVFPWGGHGLSVCTEEAGSRDDYTARWMDLCLAWLGKTFQFQL